MNPRISTAALLFALFILTAGLAGSASTPDPMNAPGGKGNAQKACYNQAENNYDICVFFCTQPGAAPDCAASCNVSYQEARAACRANN